MYILKIIPIAKGLPENDFSYFSKENLSLGTLVEIKIKNRKLYGLVSEIKEVEEKKIDIKTKNFTLKKIENIVKRDFIKEELFKSILESSILLGVRESDILKTYLPDFIFEPNYVARVKDSKHLNYLKENKTAERKYFLGNIKERIKRYDQIVKTALENKYSIVIFFPTINDLEFTVGQFSNIKENQKIILHSRQTKKQFKDNIKKLESEKFFVIFSTPSLFPFLIKDEINLKNIIIEKENSTNYFTHTLTRQIDAREMIKKTATDLDIDLSLAGNILSLESFREAKGKIEILNTKEKSKEADLIDKENIQFQIVDMIKDKENIKIKENKEANFYNNVYFSEDLKKRLIQLKENKEKIFLYAKRKGLYTEVVCSDCSSIFKCEKCDMPYTLYKSIAERYFVCTKCKEKIILRKDENLLCKNCGGHRLATLGIASEGIEENMDAAGWHTFLVDSTNVKSKKEVKNIFDSWQDTDSSALIGTDLALNFLNTDYYCKLGAIISLDSLFSIPEINIDEKIFSICLDMKEKADSANPLIIQTRLRDQPLWEYIKNNDVLGFLGNEIQTRKMLDLPPYSNILKFKLDKKEIRLKENIERIFENIWKEEVENAAHPLHIPQEKSLIFWKIDKKTGGYIGTLQIKKEKWEIKNGFTTIPTTLAKKIHTLLTDFRLEVNPQSVYQ